MPVELSLESALLEWKSWRIDQKPINSKPSVIKQFTDGLNHDVALIRCDGEELVLKVFESPNPTAIKAQVWAAHLNCAPRMLFCADDFSYCVMAKASGESIMPDTIERSQLSSIAKSLFSIHNAPRPEFTQDDDVFNIIEFCDEYLLSANNLSSDNKATELHKQVKPFLQTFISDPTHQCFCHNDLVVANCFFDQGHATFIDWEYAQVHNPWFDLAAIIYYNQLDQKQAMFFLDQYQTNWSDKVGTLIFYTSQLALLWGDMLWHLAKFGEDYWQNLEQKHADLNRLISIIVSLGE